MRQLVAGQGVTTSPPAPHARLRRAQADAARSSPRLAEQPIEQYVDHEQCNCWFDEPADAGAPAALERGAAALVAVVTDCPRLGAAPGEHAAVAAHRLATARARTRGQPAAAHAVHE